MLTELFSGHTINLADLRAVSPSMREMTVINPYLGRRILYAQFYLTGGTVIRHNVYVQEVGSTILTADERDWQAQVDQLDQQLNALTAGSDFLKPDYPYPMRGWLSPINDFTKVFLTVNQVKPMTAFTELKQLIADADKEATAFYEKKNQAAGVRLRKAMLEIKEKAQAVRVDVSETKKSNA